MDIDNIIFIFYRSVLNLMTFSRINKHCNTVRPSFKLFVPCIFSTYGMKTNWCHYFIRILLGLYMFRAHRTIFRRVRTAVHTTIGSVSVPLCSRALYVHTDHANRTNGCVNSCTNSPEDGPVGPKHVEIQQYTNKIVTSVGFHSIHKNIVDKFIIIVIINSVNHCGALAYHNKLSAQC